MGTYCGKMVMSMICVVTCTMTVFVVDIIFSEASGRHFPAFWPPLLSLKMLRQKRFILTFLWQQKVYFYFYLVPMFSHSLSSLSEPLSQALPQRPQRTASASFTEANLDL